MQSQKFFHQIDSFVGETPDKLPDVESSTKDDTW